MQPQGHYTIEDRRRLAPSRVALASVMLDGQWHSPYDLATELGMQNAGTITSHLRDLKASGIYTYQRRRQGARHEYLLTVVKPEQLPLLKGANAVVSIDVTDPLPLPEGFQAVTSTNVRAIRFLDTDLVAGELQVIFQNGGRYHYAGIPKTGFENLLKAESMGRFLGVHIKPHFMCYRADFLTGKQLPADGGRA